jgi:hypothetical protein
VRTQAVASASAAENHEMDFGGDFADGRDTFWFDQLVCSTIDVDDDQYFLSCLPDDVAAVVRVVGRAVINDAMKVVRNYCRK